jgi:hypothetical protein
MVVIRYEVNYMFVKHKKRVQVSFTTPIFPRKSSDRYGGCRIKVLHWTVDPGKWAQYPPVTPNLYPVSSYS